jgi:integrase
MADRVSDEPQFTDIPEHSIFGPYLRHFLCEFSQAVRNCSLAFPYSRIIIVGTIMGTRVRRMPRKLQNALTTLAVANAGPGRHTDGNGLHLLVKPSGTRSWVLRYFVGGKARELGLGPADGLGALSLKRARELAAAKRVEVIAGGDPVAERLRKATEARAASQASRVAGITFQASAEAYIASHGDSWRNAKHRGQWTATLVTYVYPIIGALPVADIETSHVLAVLEPIWKAKPETASRVRGRIESVLDAAKTRGHRKGENPARWRGHIDQILPKRAKLSRGHHKALPYTELPAFMNELRNRPAVAALALEFAILTGARSGEVLGATWEEVDLQAAVWTIPASRMKAGKEHRVPLCPRTLEVLETMQMAGSAHVFVGNNGRALSSMAMAMLLRRMQVQVTVHGFRSAFRDWAAEQTSFAHEVAEMALAHAITNRTEAAYRRGDLFDKRRKLMEAWATYCAAPASTGACVTPIRGIAA